MILIGSRRMRKITASEISTFLYCERAWWYQHQGIESDNLDALASGSQLHDQHNRVVVSSGLLRVVAYLVLLAGTTLLAVALVLRII